MTKPFRPARNESPTVLIVDDNEIDQLLAVRMLERRGYRSEVVENGLEALKALDRHAYAAVLMDCQMPELSGYDATRELRRRESDRHTPIIAMTAHVMRRDRDRCLAAGMDDYMPKPLKPEDMDRALGRWAPRTRSAAIAAGGPLDPEGVERIRAEFGSNGALGQLVELFGNQTPEIVADLRAAIEAGDSQSVRESAHKLKGGCTTLAASHLAGLCNALEIRAEADALDGARELVDEIETAFHDAHAALLAEIPLRAQVEDPTFGL